MRIDKRLYRKFLKNVKFTKGNCWLWEGYKKGGYGAFNWNGHRYGTHRLAVTLFLDPTYDPAGRGTGSDQVMHDCDVKNCVSPLCLAIGNNSMNMKAAYARGLVPWYRADEEARRKMSLAKKGKKLSKAHRTALSLARIGNANALGAKLSLETRLKMSKAHKGIKFTERHKANIGKANVGRTVSEETKRKISNALRRYHD